MYIYIHIVFICSICWKNANTYFKICSYIQKMTLTHLKTPKTSIHDTNTPNTQNYILEFSTFSKNIFFKN